MNVYVAPDVADVIALHPNVSEPAFRALSIRDQIAEQAETLRLAHNAGDRRSRVQLMSWWPKARGKTFDSIMHDRLTADDARLTVSREYGFGDWREVESLGDKRVNLAFERALDDLLAGRYDSLKSQLAAMSGLAAARSSYGHRSTLLHYLGSNGVETHRQVVPMNAVALAELLIDHGADIRAEADMYGGGQTAAALARTSAHPYAAGITDQLVRALE